jgi:DNA repair exonuclease SbcCD ATPase subunit
MEKTLISPDFNLQIAFTSVAFWGIIFAGFVVYIIWGLIFDHVMKEYENIDKIKAFIRKLKEEKQYYLEKKKELTTVINQLKEEITEIKEKIKRLNSKIEGFIFPNRKYLHYHAEYVKGWYIAISEAIALPRPQKEELIEKCNKVAAEHLEKHQITNEDSEGVVYNIVNL